MACPDCRRRFVEGWTAAERLFSQDIPVEAGWCAEVLRAMGRMTMPITAAVVSAKTSLNLNAAKDVLRRLDDAAVVRRVGTLNGLAQFEWRI